MSGYLAGSKILTSIKSSKPSAKYFPSRPSLATGKIAPTAFISELATSMEQMSKHLAMRPQTISALTVWLLSLLIGVSHATMPMAKNPPKVQIDANRVKQTRIAGGDWDDRTEKVQLEITATNLDLNHPADGLVLHYWVLSESQVDHRVMKVIDAGQFDVNLTARPEGRQLRHETPMIQTMWDNTDAVFGVRYKGWILVLTNAQNEIVAVKTCQPAWQSDLERLFALKKDAWCDREMKPVGEPGRRD